MVEQVGTYIHSRRALRLWPQLAGKKRSGAQLQCGHQSAMKTPSQWQLVSRAAARLHQALERAVLRWLYKRVARWRR